MKTPDPIQKYEDYLKQGNADYDTLDKLQAEAAQYTRARWEQLKKKPPTRAEILEIDPEIYMRRVFDPGRYYAIPSRVFHMDDVIGLAKQLGALLDMDVEVTLAQTNVYITLEFDEMPIMDELKLQFLTLLGMVDEISFFRPQKSGRMFRLALVYKTHVLVRKRKEPGSF